MVVMMVMVVVVVPVVDEPEGTLNVDQIIHRVEIIIGIGYVCYAHRRVEVVVVVMHRTGYAPLTWGILPSPANRLCLRPWNEETKSKG